MTIFSLTLQSILQPDDSRVRFSIIDCARMKFFEAMGMDILVFKKKNNNGLMKNLLSYSVNCENRFVVTGSQN